MANSTGQVARFIVFGSFVTSKPSPGDVDIFLLMEDSFDVAQVHGDAALVFDTQKTQDVLGASIFWIRKQGAIGSEQEAMEDWQIKRDDSRRGINDQELKATLNRIERFQKQVEKLQQVETNPRNYQLSAGGFLSEIDRMNLEVAEYLSVHSSKLIKSIVDTVNLKTDDVLFHSPTEHGWRTSWQAVSLVTE